MIITPPFKCSLCERIIKDEFGNNPYPLGTFDDGQCCDSCNVEVTAAIRAINQARKACRTNGESSL